ncbi:TetR/AcrR family transcriptional regulator [Actinomadura sp. HBU206391]|uniref:TetR/AcrR family transcriptional regulator n=1 Tax=Actinomadura sp. HBU206391 TaxID=2731692 RepID=UPI00164EFD00|nr:TetR/AcrR family transcriptional regulator [Actinomadura sp. HBU206391]MBC6460334.1 TetR family transcriptional regulator [Actinomadura sp. HBU206391]
MPRPSVEVERRGQILRAACAVMAEVGLRSLRIGDVAKRAGTSHGTVHYYFDTKRDLVHAAFEFNFQQSIDRRRPILDAHEDPRARLRAFVDSYLPDGDAETVLAWRVWIELWNEALREPDLQELNDQVYGEWRRVVAAIVRDGQDRGQFRDGDAVDTANALIGMIDGLAIQVLLGSRNMTTPRMRAICEAYLLDLEERPLRK